MSQSELVSEKVVDPDDASVKYAEYDDDGADDTCPRCHGDGADPYCDYLLPCPRCGGEGWT